MSSLNCSTHLDFLSYRNQHQNVFLHLISCHNDIVYFNCGNRWKTITAILLNLILCAWFICGVREEYKQKQIIKQRILGMPVYHSFIIINFANVHSFSLLTNINSTMYVTFTYFLLIFEYQFSNVRSFYFFLNIISCEKLKPVLN